MVFGSFDLVHKGHVNFLKQAKKLGDELIVVVARDDNIEKVKKRKPSTDYFPLVLLLIVCYFILSACALYR